MWIIYTSALSRIVYELQPIFTDFCVNRKWRNVYFSSKWHHISNKYGRFWKAINDFLFVLNCHFCNITYRLWVISCFTWFYVNRKWRDSIFPLECITCQIWLQILKGINDLLFVFNWHFCSIMNFLLAISCFRRFL